MSLEKAAWAEIARLWRETDEPAGQIAKRYGISHQMITARARREGWPPRPAVAARRGKAGAGPAGQSGAAEANAPNSEGAEPPAGRADLVNVGGTGRKRRSGRAATRRAMIKRLFDAMEAKLRAIEARMAAGGDQSAADSERTTRTLNTLVRSLEKLSDYEGKISSSKGGNKNGKRRVSGTDAERRRQELADRIQTLLKRQ